MTAVNLTHVTLSRQLLHLSGKILLLALAYLATGQVAMLLAVPPGFVSAIFPPVGVALAAVLIWGYALLPGVFLGSTLLNLGIAASNTEQLGWSHLVVACSIAMGTTIQCFVASWLIRRWPGYPTPLTEDRHIMALLLIGGPISCLISASFGTYVLYSHHIITPAQSLFSWWSWWVGDSIGVMIATPLVFIAFAKPRAVWRSRAGSVGLPLLLGCGLMMLLFLKTSEVEQNRLQQRFHEQAKLMTQSITTRIQSYAAAVMPVERLFAASKQVDSEEFATFVASLVRDNPGIRALSWNARVSSAERLSFEAILPAKAGQPGSITERDPSGALVPAAVRSHYFPITYIQPLDDNAQAIGFDVASDPVRRSALLKARDQGSAVLTAPLELVQDRVSNTAMLLFYPVYQGGQIPDSVTGRQRLLQGYVVTVLHIVQVIESALSPYAADSFQLSVTDISAQGEQSLFNNQSTVLPDYAKPLIWQQDINIAGRTFRLNIQPSDNFLRSQSSLQPWAILAIGLLLCSVLGGFLLSVTGRAEQVNLLVRQRTLELSGILDNAAEAILIFDARGKIERVNSAAQQLFGYTEHQFRQLHIASLLPELQQNSQAFLQGKHMRSVEAAGITATGTALELEISLSSYVLPEHLWYICLLHDISDRKKVERLKSEFVATVSHELRTPLTSIKGSLELIKAGVMGVLPQSASQMLDIAQQNTERLVNLVNDILDIEKLQLGDAVIPLTPVDLTPLLQQALVQNQGYANNFAVQLNLDIHALPEHVMVLANAQRLQQVLSNLISNAVKFSAAGSPVLLSAAITGKEVLVKVIDQGPGIPEEFRARIFNKFAQADGTDSRQRGGTGLGLSICQELMNQMNGHIGYDSVEGKGCTFYISLPLLPDAAEVTV